MFVTVKGLHGLVFNDKRNFNTVSLKTYVKSWKASSKNGKILNYKP